MVTMYRIGEFAQKIGRSAGTVRWRERGGRIQARRGPTGQRYFPDAEHAILRRGFDDTTRKTVVYCRVSSPGPKDDLASQVTAMEQFCLARGLAGDEWITEVAEA